MFKRARVSNRLPKSSLTDGFKQSDTLRTASLIIAIFKCVNAIPNTAKNARAHGLPPARFCHSDTNWFEMIDEVGAQADRLVPYRGRQDNSFEATQLAWSNCTESTGQNGITLVHG